MSLLTHLNAKGSPVRLFMDRELPGVREVCKTANITIRDGREGGPPVAPIPDADSALVGVAIEFVLAAAGGNVREPRIAAAKTPELAEQRWEAKELALSELKRLTGQPLDGLALERAADCGLVCARLEQRFRDPTIAIRYGHPDPAEGVPQGLDGVVRAARFSEQTRADLVGLIEGSLHDTADLYRARVLRMDPTFALSAALGGADADLISDGLLIDFKSTRDRSVIGLKDVYQVLGYALADTPDAYNVHSVGIHALRWRKRWTADLEGLLRELSGTCLPVTDWRERFAAIFPL